MEEIRRSPVEVGSWPTAHRTPWAFVQIVRFHLILWHLGVGGDDNIPCTCAHVGCYATGLGWVGRGDDNIPCTCTHVGCHATGLGWVGRGDDNIPCTCTHVGCYATGLGWVGEGR